jgi:MerR family transcriptional regulator/heat shock protein HspR
MVEDPTHRSLEAIRLKVMKIIPREQVAEHLAVSTRLLARYESRGLVRAVREGDVEGYSPAELRRLWSVLSLHRDLGINLAGIEVILRLRGQMIELQRRLGELADSLHEALEADLGHDRQD